MFEQNNNNNSPNNPFKEDEAIEETPQEVEETASEGSAEAEEKNVQADLEELNNRYLRLAADFDNYRKRQTQERQDLLKYGSVQILTSLLTVLDTIERANESMRDVEDSKTIKEGYQVVFKQLQEVLQKSGLEEIVAEGEQFDPNFHEAVMKTPTTEHPDGSIITKLQTGYKFQDKVLRPALVNVAISDE
ncbi:co-chaperone GrpE [Candidatus Gastranaerophilus sp. (ex Termes propinquus)]|nr:co-chaperone GrpE [Candidatus Gastranaerophilus sp. (ex Termes propinquus)]